MEVIVIQIRNCNWFIFNCFGTNNLS